MMKVLKPLVNGIRCEKWSDQCPNIEREVISNENIVVMRKIHTSRESGAGKGWVGWNEHRKQTSKAKIDTNGDNCGQPARLPQTP